MKTRDWHRTLCAAVLTAGISSSHAADVVIGVPNWPSVAATASILKVVLEDNFGLEVELQNGTNPVIFEAMDSGSMHVHPEVWLPNQTNLHDKFVKTRGTVRMNPNGVPSFQGMCVTKATADRTGIAQIADLADPDMAKNFDTNGDGRGEVWIGASGWASTNVEKVRAKSYGYDETMELVEMDETLAMGRRGRRGREGHRSRLLLLYAQPHVRAARFGDPRRARVRRLQVDRHPAHRRCAMAGEIEWPRSPGIWPTCTCTTRPLWRSRIPKPPPCWATSS